MQKRISILVSGRVQGVMFRQSVKKFADSLNILGIAENLLDGKVRIIGEGKEENLKKLLDFSYSGSMMAKVESVFFEWSESKQEFKDFQIKREKDNMLSDQVQAFTNLGKKLFNTKEDINLDNLTLPKHVVIIPDGNRRWAKERGMTTYSGHKAGAERIKEMIEFLKDKKVESITVWLFSVENWKRSEEEIKFIMNIFTEVTKDLSKVCLENKVVFRHLGRKNFLDKNLITFLNELEEKTKNFKQEPNSKNLNIALDYSGRDEIVRAINSLPSGVVVDEKVFTDFLDTKNIPDPDLIIRTSGERRLSGILPWQSVYSELYFTDKYFPDFDVEQLKLALLDYSNRKRRFGA